MRCNTGRKEASAARRLNACDDGRAVQESGGANCFQMEMRSCRQNQKSVDGQDAKTRDKSEEKDKHEGGAEKGAANGGLETGKEQLGEGGKSGYRRGRKDRRGWRRR